ncbi:MAG: hypothetical protein ABIK09_02560 [Pseudomonadota bacterium]
MDSDTKMYLVVGGLFLFFCVIVPIFMSIRKKFEAGSPEASESAEAPPPAPRRPPEPRGKGQRRGA